MIERALPPDDRPADPDPSARGESAPTDRRLGLQGEADVSEDVAEVVAEVVPSKAPRGDGSDCPRPLATRIEALLFASGKTLAAARIGRALNVETSLVQDALVELIAAWKAREGAVELVEVGGGYRFLTRSEYHDDVALLRPVQGPERLSPAALETLSVVAYRQPITRADVEAVRGVQSGPLLRLLQERDLIRITGRSSEPGHPLLYGTTKRFLDHFGLKSLKALPDLKDVLESA
ncbi:MAG: SMC-Scp complex subunit ScpB [Planctomycetota bacterium]|jgi:segregation and condensation protein B